MIQFQALFGLRVSRTNQIEIRSFNLSPGTRGDPGKQFPLPIWENLPD
jgi:hypothetical protein